MALLRRILDLPWALIRIGRVGGGRAVGVLAIWLGWERLTEWWWRPKAIRPDGVFRYRHVRYHGPPVRLTDGVTIHDGDLLLELHLNNRTLLRLSEPQPFRPWPLLAAGREDLRLLACAIQRGDLGPVRALRGITLLAQAGRRLGFEVYPAPPTWYTRLQRFFFVGLLAIYHPLGWQVAQRFQQRGWPGIAWMSVDQLLARYGDGCDEQSPTPAARPAITETLSKCSD